MTGPGLPLLQLLPPLPLRLHLRQQDVGGAQLGRRAQPPLHRRRGLGLAAARAGCGAGVGVVMHRVDADHLRVALGVTAAAAGDEGRGAVGHGHQGVVVGDVRVAEDLHQRQVRVDLPGAAARAPAAARPRDGDAPVLHPRDEDAARVRRVALPRAVQQRAQGRQVGLDLAHDARQAALREVVLVNKRRMCVSRHGGDVSVQVYTTFLQISAG